jgi:hypothetical protein
MPIELQTEHENLLVVKVSGKLTKDDYAVFLPKVDQLVKEQHKISILFDMHDFHGWEVTAAWEDTKFAFHHFRDIERLAVIGEKPWQKAMAVVCKPFTRAEVRYYTHDQSEHAYQWLQVQPAAR